MPSDSIFCERASALSRSPKFFDSLDRRKCNDFLRSLALSPFGDFREAVFALFSADFPLQIPIPAPFDPGETFSLPTGFQTAPALSFAPRLDIFHPPPYNRCIIRVHLRR